MPRCKLNLIRCLTASGPPIYCIFNSPADFFCHSLFNQFRKYYKRLVLTRCFGQAVTAFRVKVSAVANSIWTVEIIMTQKAAKHRETNIFFMATLPFLVRYLYGPHPQSLRIFITPFYFPLTSLDWLCYCIPMIFGEPRDNAEHTLPGAIHCQSAPVLFNAFVPSPILGRLNLLCAFYLSRDFLIVVKPYRFIFFWDQEKVSISMIPPISISNLEFGVKQSTIDL